MSLLQCPECNGKVSSMASACPHCGCPIEAILKNNDGVKYICQINGTPYDLSEVVQLLESGDKVGAIKAMRRITGYDLADCKGFVEKNIIANGNVIPKSAQLQPISARVLQNNTSTIPKCPTCGSTNLTKQTVMSRGISGFLFGRHSVEGRAQFVCNSCGYQF